MKEAEPYKIADFLFSEVWDEELTDHGLCVLRLVADPGTDHEAIAKVDRQGGDSVTEEDIYAGYNLSGQEGSIALYFNDKYGQLGERTMSVVLKALAARLSSYKTREIQISILNGLNGRTAACLKSKFDGVTVDEFSQILRLEGNKAS